MNSDDSSAAYKKFLDSMRITADHWRDGIGYVLAALVAVSASDIDSLIRLLASRLAEHGDWREMEALAAIGTPAAKNAIRQALNSSNLETQLQAAKQLSEIGEPVDME